MPVYVAGGVLIGAALMRISITEPLWALAIIAGFAGIGIAFAFED